MESSQELSEKSGTLYIVSTPIGNLGDITFRAVEVLQSVQLIACEDTRKASILSKKFEIQAPRLSYFEHNSRQRTPRVIEHLLAGENVALISDAGTPVISDPGYPLIQSCIEKGITVEHIPGPSALITALVVSGLPADRFVFEGFLPPKKGRKKRLGELVELKHTIIFYESPYRLKRTLEDLYATFGDRKVVIARELTKKFEEVVRTTLSEALKVFGSIKLKGEFVILVHGNK